MQTAKKMAATVKQKVGNVAADAEEKKEDTKFAAEEKVDKLRAHGDESAKQEATAKRNEREAGASQHREAEQRSNDEEKVRAVEPNPGPIGDKSTPADLDRVMGADNPVNPENPDVGNNNPYNDYGKLSSGPTGGNLAPVPLGPSSAGQIA